MELKRSPKYRVGRTYMVLNDVAERPLGARRRRPRWSAVEPSISVRSTAFDSYIKTLKVPDEPEATVLTFDSSTDHGFQPFSLKVREKAGKRPVIVVVSREPDRDTEADHHTAFAMAVLERLRELLGDKPGVDPSDDHGSHAAEIDTLLRGAARALEERPQTAGDGQAGFDPLQAARDRGRHQALAELEKPENLTLRDAATYSGRSDRAINEARLKGALYALVPPGKQRGLRYPQWQLNAEPDRLAAVLEPFISANASCWVVHNFMQRPLEALGDAKPMDWILDASRPIAPVVQAVVNRYSGDQGAA